MVMAVSSQAWSPNSLWRGKRPPTSADRLVAANGFRRLDSRSSMGKREDLALKQALTRRPGVIAGRRGRCNKQAGLNQTGSRGPSGFLVSTRWEPGVRPGRKAQLWAVGKSSWSAGIASRRRARHRPTRGRISELRQVSGQAETSSGSAGIAEWSRALRHSTKGRISELRQVSGRAATSAGLAGIAEWSRALRHSTRKNLWALPLPTDPERRPEPSRRGCRWRAVAFAPVQWGCAEWPDAAYRLSGPTYAPVVPGP